MDTSDKLSAGAIVLAIVSLFVSVWTACEQKAQWRGTSMGRVDVTKAAFVFWRTMDESEAHAIDWGYNVNLMPLVDGTQVTGRIGLPSRLVAYDPKTAIAYPQWSGVTRQEIEQKLASDPSVPDGLTIAKQFQLQVDLENTGASPVTELRIAVHPRMPDTGSWVERPFSQPIELAPGHPVYQWLEINGPIDTFLPSKLAIRVIVSYRTIDGELQYKVIPFYFRSESGTFLFGEA